MLFIQCSTLAQASNAIRISEHFRVVTPNVRRVVGGTVNQRHLKRNRKFVGSPLEGTEFEPSVPLLRKVSRLLPKGSAGPISWMGH